MNNALPLEYRQPSRAASHTNRSRSLRCLPRLFTCCLFLLTILAASRLSAQELQATLNGTVTDSSGAVVPGATVDIRNQDTNLERTLTSDNNGNYTATNLPAGNYTVQVKQSGFSAYNAQNVVLQVAQKRTLDIQLQAGAITQEITVQESATPIETSSSEQAGTVTGTQVRELALNNRNFEQLVLLQPGVSSQLPDEVGFGLANNTTISVNGARAGANNWTVDGADINDSGSNGTLLNVPSIDSIQEFTLARSGYDAQYGRSGGGQVLVATKAGGNEFHGDLYEFVRNDYFNANSFFGNSAGQDRPIERYNNFGFTIGGPAFIPKLYKRSQSKTYFFYSEEWRKTSTPNSTTLTVPSAAELAGTFTSPIPNAPAGCVTSSGGTFTINPSCFSQNSKAYLGIFNKYPANTGANQLTVNTTQLNNFRQDLLRVDQNISDKLHFFGRVMQDDVPENQPYGLWGGSNYPGVETTSLDAPGKNAVGNLTWTISPRMVNELEVAYSYGAINSTLNGTANSPSFNSQLTNSTVYQDPYGRAPNVNFNSGLTGLANGSAPYFERNIDRSIFDNLSITAGNHTIRFGVTAQWMKKTENASSGAAAFQFSGTNGNPEFANFLLGQADFYTQPNLDTVPNLHYTNVEGYVQDDWKIRHNLTLNLGVRYSFFPAPSDVRNTLNNFDPRLYNPALAPALDASGQFLAGQAFYPAIYTNGIIFPSGSACSQAKAVSSQISCSPYGDSVNPNATNNFGPRFGFAWDPKGDGKTSIRGGYGVFFDRTLNGIWEQNAFADPPLVQTVTINNNTAASNNLFDNPRTGVVAGPSLGANALVATGTPNFLVPNYQDYTFSVQREVVHNTKLEAAYVGTKGTHLLGDIDENQPSLAQREANPAVNVNDIRPYLGYGAIRSRVTAFSSRYDSLQVSVNSHVSNSLTLGIAYTWSKLLTNNPSDRGVAPQDTYNFASNFGPSTLNTPQIFVANYVWDLPFFKTQQGVTGKLLGGWELSGITSFQSGQSLTVTQGTDPFAALYPGGIGLEAAGFSGDALVTPDVVGALHMTKTLNQWFSTNSFTPAVGHFGTGGVGTVLGPGLQNWDLTLMKNVRFKERYSFQLRLEAFNAFNHTNYSNVDTNISSSTFGQVTGTHNPRNLQLGAKFYF
jgi:Carboxypeptidase regulatory-like domain/TonB-dependent Receptor Plug Domain